jgi:hypothetical protein
MFTRGRTRNCEHPHVTRTVNYGLIRSVCHHCGMVHIADTKTAAESNQVPAIDRPDDHPVPTASG